MTGEEDILYKLVFGVFFILWLLWDKEIRNKRSDINVSDLA